MTGTIEYEYEDEELGLNATLEIDYEATAGRPGKKYDKYGDPGNPPEAPEMEITGFRLVGLPLDESEPHSRFRKRLTAHVFGADVVRDLCWEDFKDNGGDE